MRRHARARPVRWGAPSRDSEWTCLQAFVSLLWKPSTDRLTHSRPLFACGACLESRPYNRQSSRSPANSLAPHLLFCWTNRLRASMRLAQLNSSRRCDPLPGEVRSRLVGKKRRKAEVTAKRELGGKLRHRWLRESLWQRCTNHHLQLTPSWTASCCFHAAGGSHIWVLQV